MTGIKKTFLLLFSLASIHHVFSQAEIQNPVFPFWKIKGNSGTNSSTNFIGTTDAVDWVIRTNNTERARVSSTGNVGIGTTAPSAQLHVYTSNLAVNAASVRIQPAGGAANTTSQFSLIDLWSTFDNFAGNQGPRRTASIKSFFSGGPWGNEALSFNVGGSNDAAIEPTEQMRITGAGNVGINTTAPAQRLHVSGTLSGVRVGGLATGGSFITPPSTNTDKLLFGDANGDIRSIANGTSGQTLTINGSGVPTWTSAGASTAWNLTGNSGTTVGTNFIGTTDGQPLMFKVNNNKAGLIEYASSSANTSLGYHALNVNTGTFNAAVGYEALAANTTGFRNTAIGLQALQSNTTASNAVALGYQALLANTTGNSNIAIGFQPMKSNLTGNDNTAMGFQALISNTTGSGNIGIGFQTLYDNTTANYNTAVGYMALSYNTTGTRNTAIGYGALYANITGDYNTAVGDDALQTNTTGSANMAIGHYSLFANTTGSANSSMGSAALRFNSTGNDNNAIGNNALYNNITGDDNVAMGNSSAFNNTGSRNTAFGTGALTTNTTGTNNTAVGYGADVSSIALTNATAIGYNAKVAQSNSLVLGATGADAVNVGIGTTGPLYKLHLIHTSATEGLLIQNTTGGSGTMANLYFATYADVIAGTSRPGARISAIDDGNFSAHITFTTKITGSDANALTERMRITNSGYVGIGTTNPTQAMLVVNGSQNNTLSYGYLNSGGNTGTTSGTAAFSIYASARIAATEFNAYSDARIKNIIGVTDNQVDLTTLNQIRITDYRFVDTVAKGTGVSKKVIAQELEKTYPQAVNKITDVVPDIYRLAEIKHGYVAVENKLQKGDKVKLIFAAQEELQEVINADANGFTVDSKQEGKVFVFGKQVDDFRTVDYEALTTLSISAIQQLSKENEELKRSVSNLTDDVELLKTVVGVKSMK